MIDEIDFESRVRKINWVDFYTAYGRAVETPEQLIQLANTNYKIAMDASHELWCGLCHQHAYISSAALPALPFILEVLDDADENLTIEILDILLGFSFCTSSEYYKNCIGNIPTWEIQLREKLENEISRFHKLKDNENEKIRSFAQAILENLNLYSPSI